MNIGVDARLWNETGVGRYIRNLVSNLSQIDTENQYTLFLRKPEYQSVELPGKNFKKKLADARWHTLEEQIQFVKILNKEKLDLVHFPYFSFPYLYRRKFVMTIHDLIIHHFSTGQASTLPAFVYDTKVLGYKFLLQSGARRAEKIITVSHSTKSEIIDHLHVPENKIIVTYEGVDKRIMNHESGIKNGNIQKKYFLYVGNAYPHKNLERLISAFVEFRKKHNDVQLICVGKDDFFYKRIKKSVEQLHLNSEIIFQHTVSDKELSNLYQHAIALVLPSFMEGFGLPAVEAMANNCLVAVSDIPSLHEICDNAGIYFHPENTGDMTQALLRVYEKRKDFDKNKIIGLERVKKFSWERMAKETLYVYESCTGL